MANKIDIVVAAQDKATEIIKSVNSQVSILAETLGLVAVASGALAGFAASKEFVELEKASRRLEPALRDLARAMEIGTNTDEKTILGLMGKIQKRGFATDQIDDAAKAALGLSEVMGISLNDALLEVKAAAEGNFAAFEYLIPNINQLASSEEKLAAVSKLASQGLQEKADIANKAVSVFDRMNVEMGNLNATVGKIIEPFRQLAQVFL
jgi:ABC-type transporter Mla subunit MlaD